MSGSPLKRQHVHAAGAAALVALTLATFVLVVRPWNRQRSSLAALRQDLEAEQTRVADLESKRSLMQLRLSHSRNELSSIDLQLQSADVLNAQVAALTKLLESCGLVIQKTDIGSVREETWYRVVPITLTGTGRYRTCALFMQRLRETMPDVGIKSFQLSSNPRSGGGVAEFQLDLAWYAAPARTATAE